MRSRTSEITGTSALPVVPWTQRSIDANVRLDALEPGPGIDRKRIELGIDHGELRVDRRDSNRDLIDPALEPIEPSLDAIEAFDERGLPYGDLGEPRCRRFPGRGAPFKPRCASMRSSRN